MYKSENLQQLMNLAQKSAQQINKEITIFDQWIKDVQKNVPDDQKSQVEEINALLIKAVNLAKMGKAEEAQELVKNYKHGR